LLLHALLTRSVRNLPGPICQECPRSVPSHRTDQSVCATQQVVT